MRCLLPAVHIVHSCSGIARQRCREGVLLRVPLRSFSRFLRALNL
ncbi:hypothetical protein T03_13217 [Trichinella britovi]|uniref:Uncharacterized protein n=1 Tax=Trichinella britovi TaxID=45882 RepID=A0A0V0YTL9_TRIBR|nr:hypothetical protein T03_13217 [Trichinella britovi]